MISQLWIVKQLFKLCKAPSVQANSWPGKWTRFCWQPTKWYGRYYSLNIFKRFHTSKESYDFHQWNTLPSYYSELWNNKSYQPLSVCFWARDYIICTWLHLILEKAMAAHSSTLAWKIPWMEEPGGLQSMGSLRVRHDWATSLSLFTFMHWRRKWQPTPVFLPGASQGRGSLVGCCLWGCTESDTTEVT